MGDAILSPLQLYHLYQTSDRYWQTYYKLEDLFSVTWMKVSKSPSGVH